jgi:hypothetical protein
VNTPIDRDRLAAVQGEAALQGITVHVVHRLLTPTVFLATRFGLSRAFDSLEALAAWLRDLIVEVPNNGRHK